MKYKFSFLLLLSALFFGSGAFAQVSRDIGISQYKRPKQKKQQVDFVEQTAEYLQKELKLDAFQTAVVRETIEGEKEKLLSLSKNTDMSENEKADKGKEISDRIDTKILQVLTPQQQEQYKEMQKKKKKP